MTNTGKYRPPYTVRQTKSGYTGEVKYLVVQNPGGRRVSVHAHQSRRSAQFAADDLNIGDLVKPHTEDPRPYAERRAEAEVLYRTLVAR